MSEYIVDYELIPLKWRDGYGLSDIDLTEEIVRCRDCEHFEKTVQFGICHRSEFLPMWAELNGYCAWAKRKESGDD